jgi:hypothetical protein
MVGPMVQKRAGEGVETTDAGSCPSRRRVSTTGSENPLPIVRLPEWFVLESAAAKRAESGQDKSPFFAEAPVSGRKQFTYSIQR